MEKKKHRFRKSFPHASIKTCLDCGIHRDYRFVKPKCFKPNGDEIIYNPECLTLTDK